MPKEYRVEFKVRSVRLVKERLASDEMLSHGAPRLKLAVGLVSRTRL